MPAVSQPSFLAGHQKDLVQSHKENKGKAPKVGGARLPAGIESGIAKLVLCKIDLYKEGNDKGKPYFGAAGIVLEPKLHDGQPIAGMRTMLSNEPLFPTPTKSRKTWREHFDHVVLNILVPLAGKAWQDQYDSLPCTTDAEANAVEKFILDTMAALVAKGVTFRFRTWKGKKQKIAKMGNGRYSVINDDGSGNPRGSWTSEEAAKADPTNKYVGSEPLVNEVWLGAVDYSAPDAGPDVEEQLPEPADEAGTAPTDETPSATAPADEPLGELLNLAQTADGDPDTKTAAGLAANNKLQELAGAAGIDLNHPDYAALSWAGVVAEIQKREQAKPGEPVAADDDEPAAADDDDVAADDDTPPEPVQGGHVGYKKKGGKDVVQYEVATVNKTAKTVTLQMLTGKNAGKKLAGTDGKAAHVPWDELTMA